MEEQEKEQEAAGPATPPSVPDIQSGAVQQPLVGLSLLPAGEALMHNQLLQP